MKRNTTALVLAAVMVAALSVTGAAAQDPKPKVQIPDPGVPQIMTIEGAFIRAAYNNEGYVILGYRLANNSIGEPWILLEIGTTLRDGQSTYKLKRDAISLDTPDGKHVALPSNEDFQKANLMALERRAAVTKDNINYFPGTASKPCRIGFFAELTQGARAWDEVEMSPTRACVGRVYFPVPGGIAYGQYWLNLKFKESVVRVPFRILTKDEEKTLSKNYKDIKKQVEEAFAPKKK